jgi:CTP:molybdopterin cytidylyltransferase MocA
VTNTPPLTVERTVGVILAAGQGSRFSGPTHKLTAPFRGRAVVSWTIEAAINAGFDQVLVVTGNEPLGDVISATGAVEVHNERWATGQGSSLAAAIAFVTQHLEDIRSDTPLVVRKSRDHRQLSPRRLVEWTPSWWGSAINPW